MIHMKAWSASCSSPSGPTGGRARDLNSQKNGAASRYQIDNHVMQRQTIHCSAAVVQPQISKMMLLSSSKSRCVYGKVVGGEVRHVHARDELLIHMRWAATEQRASLMYTRASQLLVLLLPLCCHQISLLFSLWLCLLGRATATGALRGRRG